MSDDLEDLAQAAEEARHVIAYRRPAQSVSYIPVPTRAPSPKQYSPFAWGFGLVLGIFAAVLLIIVGVVAFFVVSAVMALERSRAVAPPPAPAPVVLAPAPEPTPVPAPAEDPLPAAIQQLDITAMVNGKDQVELSGTNDDPRDILDLGIVVYPMSDPRAKMTFTVPGVSGSRDFLWNADVPAISARFTPGTVLRAKVTRGHYASR